MAATVLLLVFTAVYAVPPLLYSLVRSGFRYVMLYTHLAAVLTLGGLLGSVFVLDLGWVQIAGGQIAYAGFLYTAVVTMVLTRDIQVLRNVVVLTLVVNTIVAALFHLAEVALAGGDGVLNPLGVPGVLFGQSLRPMLVGWMLIVVEIVGLLVVLELAKRRLSGLALGLAQIVGFVAVLVADGVLFPILAIDGGTAFVPGGIRTKLVLAGIYTVPLLVFVLVRSRAVESFAAPPLPLRDIVRLTSDPLLERLDDTARDVARLNALVAGVIDASTTAVLIVIDDQRLIRHFNRGAELLLGYRADEVVGRPPQVLFDQEELDRQGARVGLPPGQVVGMLPALAGQEHRDWHFLARDGRHVVVSLAVSEIRDGDALLGFLATGEDVTRRVRTEEALSEALAREQAAVARLEEADRVKDELVSTISHELRTPITSIQGYSELVASGAYGELTPEQQQPLEKVLRNSGRLRALVDDLLFVAHGDAVETAARLVPIDLCDVVRAASEGIALIAERRGVAVEESLPETPAAVAGDPQVLERLLLNLVGNAIKFSPDGGRVLVSVRCTGESVTLLVEDGGIGIPDADLERVFDRFFRSAEATERTIEGTGLGLSVARRIVRLHHGSIRIDSRHGEGTTVSVRLPAVASPAGT